MAGNKIELKLSIKENLFQPEKQKQMWKNVLKLTKKHCDEALS